MKRDRIFGLQREIRKNKGIMNKSSRIERSLLLSALVVCATVVISGMTAMAASFQDVSDDAYYAAPVAWAVEQGITTGTGNGNFSPEAYCTRGQVMTFIYKASNAAPVDVASTFKDVHSSDYFYEPVLWAVSQGITSGTSSDTFSPGAYCTRGQVVTFLWKLAGSPQTDVSHTFADVEEGQYYYNAVSWAVNEGITSGTSDSTFSPDQKCSRGQIVTFLYKDLAGNEAQKEGKGYTQEKQKEELPTLGEQNALSKANSYLEIIPFSYDGLVEQLEYEGYSETEAHYGADHCGANWNEQALKKAHSYLEMTSFSYQGLVEQLEYEKFTPEQARYGADHCGADWNEQAARKAQSYLDIMPFSHSGLVEQLKFEGFTTEQAEYGVSQTGL